ncbi:hypothetical protein ACFL21_03930 [Patescibacteria group bacterium]
MKEGELYYRATETGTIIHPESSDPEVVGWQHYRAIEREAIMRFVDSDDDVLVMGGLSSTVKTYTAHALHREHPFAYLDLQNVRREHRGGVFDAELLESFRDWVLGEHCLPERPPIDDPQCLIVDESVLLYNNEDLIVNATAILRILLDTYGKVVLLGGGAFHTEDEQAERITDLLPSNLSISAFPFRTKPLNTLQIKEMILSFYLHYVRKHIPEKLAEALAEMYFSYFRLDQKIRTSLGSVMYGKHYDNFMLALRHSFMPDECFMVAEDIQRQAYHAAMPEIRRLVSENS